MIQVFKEIKYSPNAKLYILIAFCVTAALIFISRSGSESEHTPLSEPLAMSKDSEPMAGMRTGGLGRVFESNDEVKSIIEQIKPTLEEQTKMKFSSIDVIHYRPQVVAGTNFFIKAKAKPVDGEEQIVHLRIYRDLARKLELTAYQLGKKLGDTLEYFQ